jgi:hypothetical protein
VDKLLEEMLEEYKEADRSRRMDLWFMFVELRDEFDEIDRCDKNLYRKFGVDPCAICCGR